MVSLKSWSSLEFEIKKNFSKFLFFKELSRIKILCGHVIFGMISFTFSVIFFQTMIFSLNYFNSKLHFTPQKELICIPNTQKVIKRLVLVSYGSLLLKHSNPIWELFFRKLHIC